MNSRAVRHWRVVSSTARPRAPVPSPGRPDVRRFRLQSEVLEPQRPSKRPLQGGPLGGCALAMGFRRGRDRGRMLGPPGRGNRVGNAARRVPIWLDSPEIPAPPAALTAVEELTHPVGVESPSPPGVTHLLQYLEVSLRPSGIRVELLDTPAFARSRVSGKWRAGVVHVARFPLLDNIDKFHVRSIPTQVFSEATCLRSRVFRQHSGCDGPAFSIVCCWFLPPDILNRGARLWVNIMFPGQRRGRCLGNARVDFVAPIVPRRRRGTIASTKRPPCA